MSELVHTSKIRVFQDKRPKRRAYIEGFETPLVFGVHGGIKEFYGIEPEEEFPSTLDHLIAAVGGWLTGTLNGALAARGITHEPGELYSDVEGDIRNVDGTMVITDIRVTYHLKVPADKREAAERALSVHERGCPAAQSVKRGINIEYSVEVEEV